MKRNKNLGIGIVALIAIFAIVGIATPVYAADLVTQDLNTITPNDLANSLLGSGVTINSVGYTGANIAAGTFSGGTGIIGFEQGIILSSGNIKNVIGPNVQDGITAFNGLPGDSDLALLIPGYSTHDASVLNIKFVPTGSVLEFKYVFASDEYNEYSNSIFNDVFGFLLNGNNVALLPGTNIAVSINNVNGGNPYGTNPQHSEYFINNDLNDGGATINTEMDGLTTVLTVTTNVNPNEENIIKLAIADSGDSALDSNVFIESGSFSSPQLTLTPLTATNNVGVSHTLTATLLDSAGSPLVGKTITFTITGPNAQVGTGVTDINGVTTFTYTGIDVGIDQIVATGESHTSNNAYATWEPSLNQLPIVSAGEDAVVNEGSSFSQPGSFIDPDTDDTWTGIVNYGDGAASEPLALNPDKTFNLSHVYLDNGVYSVIVTINDDKDGVGTDTVLVTVNNVAPTVTTNDSYFITAPIIMRIAGQGKVGNSVALEVIQDGNVVASEKIIRTPSSPNEQEVTVMATIDLSKQYSGKLLFDTETAYSGGTPVWLITDGVNLTKVTTFTTQKNNTSSYHQIYEFDLAKMISVVNKEIFFTGTATDPGTDDMNFNWLFGDSGSANMAYPWPNAHSVTEIVKHTYLAAGSYEVTLNVTDDEGDTGTATKTIVIS